jgi:hypothetical protein
LPQDDPRRIAYEKELNEWLEEYNSLHDEGTETNYQIMLNHGVIEWRPPAHFLKRLFWKLTGTGWRSEPPDGWELPSYIRPSILAERRVDYILSELLCFARDMTLVGNVIYAPRPVTQEEVNAQWDKFRSDEEARSEQNSTDEARDRPA